jgi:hypothetical protein
MTRFTSRLAIATVAFGLVAGFGPGLMQPAFAGKGGGHEAAQHETNGGKGADHASTDKSGGTSSVDKGEKGGKGSVDTNSADKAGGTSSVDKGDKGGNKGDTETEAAETETGNAGSK